MCPTPGRRRATERSPRRREPRSGRLDPRTHLCARCCHTFFGHRKRTRENASLRRRRNRTRDRGFAAPAPRCQRVPVCVFRLKLCRCAWLRPLSSGALLSNFVSLRRAIQRRLRRCRAQGAWRVCSTLCFFHHKPPSVPSNLVATTHEMDRFRGATHACFRLRSGPRTRSYKTTALPMS